MNKIIYLLLVINLSCRENHPLLGKWKLEKCILPAPYASGRPSWSVDASDTSKINRILFDMLPRHIINREIVERAHNCYFKFRNDQSFEMYDIGFIVPPPAGSYIGRELNGSWTLDSNNVISIGGITDHTKQYKIISLAADTLILGEIYDGRTDHFDTRLRLIRE